MPGAGCQVFRGIGDELGTLPPLLPFLDALRVREPSANALAAGVPQVVYVSTGKALRPCSPEMYTASKARPSGGHAACRGQRHALFRRTVSTHVSHILKKLGVGSRTDIARESALRTAVVR